MPLGRDDQMIHLFVDIAKYLYRTFRYIRQRNYLLSLGASLGRRLTIEIQPNQRLDIGRGVHFGDGSILKVTSEYFEGDVNTVRVGELVVGDNTFFNEYCNLRASGSHIRIGKNCIFAQFVSVIAANHSLDRSGETALHLMSSKKTGVDIEDNVWIGASVTILPGVKIGKGSIVAANSVVTKNVPPNSVWIGTGIRRIT
jgi:acetyltransferase-like isoleucine patch superfamily enzyme